MSIVACPGRIDLRVPILLRLADERVTCETRNIGLGGMFVVAHGTALVGQRVSLEFTLPRWDEAVVLAGEVRWIRPRDDGHHCDGFPGIGVKFVKLSLHAAVAIDNLVRSHTASKRMRAIGCWRRSRRRGSALRRENVRGVAPLRSHVAAAARAHARGGCPKGPPPRFGPRVGTLFRPAVTTVLVAALGLHPDGDLDPLGRRGSSPAATVVIGAFLSSTVLGLIVRRVMLRLLVGSRPDARE